MVHRRVQSGSVLVGGVAVLASAVSGVPPAAASERSTAAPARPSRVLDGDETGVPMPSADDLAMVQALTSMSTMDGTLSQRFPDGYGGYYFDGQQFVIQVSGLVPTMHTFVTDMRQSILSGAPPGTEEMVPIAYAQVEHSLQSLTDLSDRISADLPTLAADGVWGVGVDTGLNAVTVYTEAPVAGLGDQLAATYDTDAIRLVVDVRPEPADRGSDSPPWNAGNAIQASGTGAGCSSGFGMHDRN